jgi:hypothetical protein
MGHHHKEVDLNDNYTFSPGLKKLSLGLMVGGLLAFIAGAAISGNGTRILADLLHNTIFFTLICLISVFFLSFNYMANAGWSVLVKRVPEAISQTLPYMAGMLALLMLYIVLGKRNDIFVWLNLDAIKNEEVRELLESKSGYLNVPFFIARILIYTGVWSFCAITLRKYSLIEDQQSAGTLKYWKKSTWLSGFFLVFFAVTISTSSWDWLMSIDTKWYSTMFGWYTFVSALVSGISLIMLVIQYLRSQGNLKNVTDEHVHDIGKFMFAFSILWTYLWYSQYMLISYSNNPEETVYFRQRMDHYEVLFFANLIINFVSPLLILMTRGAKRNAKTVIFIGALIIFGHWVDFYQMVMPGTIGNNWNIGLMEIGLPIFFIGLIINRTFTNLEKAPLIPKNHPYLPESIQHFT